jgi:prepilin-type N-terminal cleavage/methylation domain-containing protein
MKRACGFTLIEVLVAMVVLTVALMGMGRLAGEGVRQGAEATRLALTLEVIEHVAATGRDSAGGDSAGRDSGGRDSAGQDSGPLRGCDVTVRSATAAIAWRWIEARCRRSDSAAGERIVTRRVLVPQ